MKKDTALQRIFFRYLVLTVIAGVMVLFFSRLVHVNQTTVAFAFLILVSLTAYRWRLASSIYASLICTLLFNVFFLPPFRRLTIADPQNWVALAGFLFTSVLVSHLSDRERRQAEVSEARRRDLELLYRFSQELLTQNEVREVAQSTPRMLASVFGFRAVALYLFGSDTVFSSDPDQLLVPSAELKYAGSDSDETVSTRNGFKFIELRLGIQHRLGRVAVTDDGLAPGMYEAIGSLVSVALERAGALERSSRMEAARESERLRSALIDSVTHDLRTPLTAIRAAATTLQGQPSLAEAERNDLIAVMEEESARLDRLIGQAVEMAAIDAQSLHLDLQPQDVRELIEQTVERMHRVLHSRPVEIQVSESLPVVWADRSLFERVLQHLLENAVAYSSAGDPITISARSDRTRLLVSVKDRGPGIDPEDLPFIFDKYFRGKQHKNKRGGTGMGLAIAQAIMKIHQGGITAESRPGEGSAFTCWIPLSLSTSQPNSSSPSAEDSHAYRLS